MSSQQNNQESKTRNTDVSRSVAMNEKKQHVTRADIENYLSIIKGPLHVTEAEKADPDYYHCWVDASRPARLDKYLDWGAVIVQRHDRNGKLKDDVCLDHGDHLVHIKIPREVKKIIDELKRERRLKAQGHNKVDADMTEFDESGSPITHVKTTF